MQIPNPAWAELDLEVSRLKKQADEILERINPQVEKIEREIEELQDRINAARGKQVELRQPYSVAYDECTLAFEKLIYDIPRMIEAE